MTVFRAAQGRWPAAYPPGQIVFMAHDDYLFAGSRGQLLDG
jgi:hypothetical protein